MTVNLSFAHHIHVIEFEPFMGENIDDYIEAFNKWYYDKKKMKLGITFMPKERFLNKPMDTNLILEWLNEICPNCNEHVVMRNIDLENENVYYINF